MWRGARGRKVRKRSRRRNIIRKRGDALHPQAQELQIIT